MSRAPTVLGGAGRGGPSGGAGDEERDVGALGQVFGVAGHRGITGSSAPGITSRDVVHELGPPARSRSVFLRRATWTALVDLDRIVFAYWSAWIVLRSRSSTRIDVTGRLTVARSNAGTSWSSSACSRVYWWFKRTRTHTGRDEHHHRPMRRPRTS